VVGRGGKGKEKKHLRKWGGEIEFRGQAFWGALWVAGREEVCLDQTDPRTENPPTKSLHD